MLSAIKNCNFKKKVNLAPALFRDMVHIRSHEIGLRVYVFIREAGMSTVGLESIFTQHSGEKSNQIII